MKGGSDQSEILCVGQSGRAEKKSISTFQQGLTHSEVVKSNKQKKRGHLNDDDDDEEDDDYEYDDWGMRVCVIIEPYWVPWDPTGGLATCLYLVKIMQ